MTHLAAAIMVDDPAAAITQAERAKREGADLVELRLDRLAMQPQAGDAARRLVQACPLPSIVTCRPEWEGGEYLGDEENRLAVLSAACGGPRRPVYVDIELAAYQRSAEVRAAVGSILDQTDAPGLILSSHDFTGRPADLLRRVEAMADEPRCRVIKIAWTARSLRDNLEAFDLLRSAVKPMIALCMGEAGLPSRVLAKKFRAVLSFARIGDDPGTAVGQPTLRELRDLYRWNEIGRDTSVYGVVGWPVGHSRSPAYHNARFTDEHINAVYLPMPIPPEYEHFKATMLTWLDWESLHFRGASVTIPHKENLLRFVEERGGTIEPLAASIGAANTLAVRSYGGLEASNTDYAAAIAAVCDATGILPEGLAGKGVAVLGAGGAARAVATGFAAMGARVTIYNRSVARAEALAEQIGETGGGRVRARSLEDVERAQADIWVNCTPVGMHPDADTTPLPDPPPSWGPGTVVFDTIYNPRETRLLRDAAAAGCTLVHGDEMFDRQAAAQFDLWTRPLAVSSRLRKEQRRKYAVGFQEPRTK